MKFLTSELAYLLTQKEARQNLKALLQFIEPLPSQLAGRKLGETGLSGDTGLNAIALQKPDGPAINPTAETELGAGLELVMLGSQEQLVAFRKRYA